MSELLRVLLADDDPDDRDLFLEAVSAPDITAETVVNGVALLEHLNACDDGNLPHCIFLDLNMPSMGGKEALQEIRGNSRLQSLPVIIYSTSFNRRDVDETFALGANRYLVKPTSYVQMQQAIQTLAHMNWNDFRANAADFVYAV